MDRENIQSQIDNMNEQDYKEEVEKLIALGGDPDIIKEKKMDYAQLEEVVLGLEAGIDTSIYTEEELPWFLMEEMRLGLEHGVDIRPYLHEGYDWMQLSEIRLGLEHGIDGRIYAKREYVSQQMHEIRLGLENDIDVSIYANPEYDWFQMEEIRKGLERNMDVSRYKDKKYSYLVMREIRKAMEKGIDLMPYVEKGYDPELLTQIRRCILNKLIPDAYLEIGYNASQLEQIRNAYEKNIDIKKYLSVEMLGSQLEEIIAGMEVGVDVSTYAKKEYFWQQMREIRLGLENRVDVSYYSNPFFSYQQMQEIRLGLQAGLDVTSYAKLIYSATDMKNMREKLSDEEAREITLLTEALEEEITPSFVTISHDGMEAELELAEPSKDYKYTEQDVIDILKAQGVVLGIDKSVIHTMIEQEMYAQKVLVARGQRAVAGEDGRYEFHFRTELPTKPKVLEDGSVDYMNMDYFEEIKQGQTVATYIPPTMGKGGYTVGGKIILAKRGKEKPLLRGKGFILLDDKCTYVSTITGKVEINDYYLNISKLHVVDGDVTYTTGNITFDGDLIVRGCVRSGVTIKAGGNIEVDGNVESANLISEGDILVKEGVQGSGEGTIKAKGRITGSFFESVTIVTERDVRANYILNCDITAQEKVIISGKKGVLVGGITRAIQGIEVFDLGNVAEHGTTVEIGITKKFFEKYNALEKNIIKIQSESKIFQEGIQKFERTYTKVQLAEISVYDKIKLAYEMKTEELAGLLKQKEVYEEEMNQMAQAKVLVRGKVYAGVHVVIDRIPLRLTDSVSNVTFRHIEDRVAVFRN